MAFGIVAAVLASHSYPAHRVLGIVSMWTARVLIVLGLLGVPVLHVMAVAVERASRLTGLRARARIIRSTVLDRAAYRERTMLLCAKHGATVSGHA
jgi:hypothetical protein